MHRAPPAARCGNRVALWLRGLTIREYIASRDPVAGTVYYAMAVLFAIMPLLVGQTCNRGADQR